MSKSSEASFGQEFVLPSRCSATASLVVELVPAHHTSPVTHHLRTSGITHHGTSLQSRLRWPAVVLALLFSSVLIIGCGSDPPKNAANYVVKKGDTLYSIAWRHNLDYRELARWNGIGRDFAIAPGQVLRLTKSGAAPSPKPPAQARTASPTPSVSPPKSSGPPVQWSWPVSGGTVTLTSRPNGGQGLTIGGLLGQDIKAAAAGRVVYTGSGLLGYGQLVIIKHNDTYLSAYGHTQSVRVKEQDAVVAGQPIATMGAGPNGSPMLYFEIRVNGIPTDPTPMLPK